MTCSITYSGNPNSVSGSMSVQLPPLCKSMTFQFTSVHRVGAIIKQGSSTITSISADSTAVVSATITDFSTPLTITLTQTSSNPSGVLAVKYVN